MSERTLDTAPPRRAQQCPSDTPHINYREDNLARSELVYTAFLSSPSGLIPDRNAVAEAVREVNMHAKDYRYRIELLRWEIDVIPERGTDAQSVINEQCASYDVFIGLIGSRFGTETPRHGSGTEEEYEEAVKKHNDSNGRVTVLFYRCKTPIDPFLVDADQLSKVNNFLRRIRNNGQLVQDYSTPEELSALIRLALPRVIAKQQQLSAQEEPLEASQDGSRDTNSLSAPKCNKNVQHSHANDMSADSNEPGLLDLLVASDDSFSEVVSITDDIGQMTADLAARIGELASQIDSSRSGTPAVDIRRSRLIIDTAASHLDAYAVNLRQKTSMLSEAVESGVNLTIELFSQSVEARVALGTDRQRTAAVETLSATVAAFDPTIDAMTSFRSSLDNAPPLTSRFSAARRSAKEALSYLISELTRQKQMIQLCVDATSTGLTLEDVCGDDVLHGEDGGHLT